MSVGYTFCDWDASMKVEKKDEADRISRIIIPSTRYDEAGVEYASVFNSLKRSLFLAISPMGGPILSTIYGIGFLIGCFSSSRRAFGDGNFDECCFDRNRCALTYIVDEQLDESIVIVSEEQRREHALVGKCATISLFAGCLGNCALTRYNYTILAKARAPFFLLGAFGVALGKYSSRYKHERNEALINEAENVRKRLLFE